MNVQKIGNTQHFGGNLNVSSLGHSGFVISKHTTPFQDGVAKSFTSPQSLIGYIKGTLGIPLDLNLERLQYNKASDRIILMDRCDNEGTLVTWDLNA